MPESPASAAPDDPSVTSVDDPSVGDETVVLPGQTAPRPPEMADTAKVETDELQLDDPVLDIAIPGVVVTRLVGRGGMGVVLEAQQTHPVRRRIAIKVIDAGRVKDGSGGNFLGRFKREQALLAQLEHPYVARLYDAGEAACGRMGTRPYYTMEYVDGRPLAAFCNERRLCLKDRLRLFIKVCEAMQFLHTRQIVHRDLKPDNVLVTTAGGPPVPKVIDFGLAKITGTVSDEDATRPGVPLGSLRYMSPEQTGRTDAEEVDATTDTYALGVLLYELICGDTPVARESVPGTDVAQILERITAGEVVPPSRRLASRPKEHFEGMGVRRRRMIAEAVQDLDWIIAKALQKDRRERYASADALAADVQAYLDKRPVAAHPGGRHYTIAKAAQRNRVTVLTVGGVFLALGMAAGLSFAALTDARAARRLADDRAARIESEREKAREATESARRSLVDAERARAEAEAVTGQLRTALAEGRRAQDEATEAKSLSDARGEELSAAAAVMAGVFDGLNPEVVGPDGDLRSVLLERLLGAAEEFGRFSVATDPGMLDLKVSIASAIQSLGRLEEAVPLIEQINEEVAAGESFDLRTRVSVMARMSEAYRRAKMGDRAVEAAERTRTLVEARLPEDDPLRTESLLFLAAALTEAGRLDRSVEVHGQIQSLVDREDPEQETLYYQSLADMATAYRQMGRSDEAVELLRRVREYYDGRLPESHPARLYVDSGLALAMTAAGQNAPAVALLREFVRRSEELFATDTVRVGRAKILLASALSEAGIVEESLDLLSQVAGENSDAEVRLEAAVERMEVLRAANRPVPAQEALTLGLDIADELGRDHDLMKRYESAVRGG